MTLRFGEKSATWRKIETVADDGKLYVWKADPRCDVDSGDASRRFPRTTDDTANRRHQRQSFGALFPIRAVSFSFN